MSYTVFALKWRPKGFDEVVGQPHIVSNIAAAIEKNRVAHAYLFSGPRGVGKTSCARIFAKALNCVKGPTPDPCGECPSCRDITAGRSLDVLEIDGASNRGIDEIRTLRENVKFAPASGRHKIYIIDEVHQITPDGFNALLKTLEEPPEFVKFVFATTAPQKVPSTILSRCQRMDFRRISVMEIIAQLEKIAAAEGVAVSRDVLFAVARASDGALRDAESIFDQLLSFSRAKVTVDDVIAMLGNVQLESLFQIGEAAKNGDSRAMLETINELIDKGKDASVLLQDIIGHFRNLMVARVSGADGRLIDLPADWCERLVAQASGFAMEELFTAFNILVETQDMARRMESVRIPLEINLLRLCSPRVSAGAGTASVVVSRAGESTGTPSAVVPRAGSGTPAARPARTEASRAPYRAEKPQAHVRPAKSAGGAPGAEVAQEEPELPAVISAGPEKQFTLEEVLGSFEEILRDVARTRMSVATYMRAGVPERVEGNVVSIGFPREQQFYKEFMEKKENRLLLEQCFSGRFGTHVKVKFTLSDREPVDPEAQVKDPAIRSAIDMFKGRLI